MSSIYTLLMAALDLAGIIFNLQMLRSCFKDKEKYTFLQKCRTLTICQCACQVIILLADGLEMSKGLKTESCDIVRVLSNSTLFFQGCNLMAILIISGFDQPTEHGTSRLCTKLKISAALSLGLFGSAIIWWNSYFSQDRLHIFRMTSLPILFVVSVAFIVLLFAWDAKNIIHDKVKDDSQEASMETCSLLWNVLQEYHRPVLFILLLLVCLLVILSWSPRAAGNEVLKDALYSVITRFVVGIVLPVTFTDLIESSKQEENGLKTAFI